jgi:hypothetical protein
VGEDVSSATKTELHIRKPDGTEVEWIATVNATVKTQLDYTIESDDFDQGGTYTGNAYIEMTAWQGRGETFEFVVYPEYQ